MSNYPSVLASVRKVTAECHRLEARKAKQGMPLGWDTEAWNDAGDYTEADAKATADYFASQHKGGRP
jgi:hypothetical protein